MNDKTADLAARMGDLVSGMSAGELEKEVSAPDRLLISRDHHRGKTIDTVWAPFDHVNTGAAVAIVGITPGKQQMGNALRSYRAARSAGHEHPAALAIAKVHASFSGDIRDHLVQMLDHVGLNRWLGLASSAALWDTRPDLAHFTSALRYPVLIDGANYSGSSPRMVQAPALRPTLETVLVGEIAALPSHAIIVPLGPKVEEAIRHALGFVPGFDMRRLLWGLPHPSPGNRTEIYPFLELPPSPSRSKPVPETIAQRCETLRRQIAELPPRPRALAA